MTLKIPLWVMIPSMMLFTLIFFAAFEAYTWNEWGLDNGILAAGIGLIYLGEKLYGRKHGK